MILPSKPSVVITSSSSLLGHATIAKLCQDFHIHAWDAHEPASPLPDDASFRKVDIHSPASIDQAVDALSTQTAGHAVAIVHLLAHTDFEGNPSELYDRITAQGSRKLLRAVQRHGIELEQFIFASTMLVHEPTRPCRPINEKSPLDPRWNLPHSAVVTEEILREEHDELPLVLLRLAHTYTDQCDAPLLARQIQRIHERKLTARIYPGNIHHGQACLHIDDAANAIAQTIERRDSLHDEIALLIGEPTTLSYDQLQRQIAQLIHSDPDWQTRTIPKTLARTGVWVRHQVPGIEEPFVKGWMIDVIDDHYELDIHRAGREINWQPTRRLADTLPRMIGALKRDPVQWYRRHHLPLTSELKARAPGPRAS